MHLRHYSPIESPAIEKLFYSAFAESEGEAEGRLVGELVHNMMTKTDPRDLFVFVQDDEIIGSILITRMPTEKESELFLLAPVAVLTARQGEGIGQKLIHYGIEELRARGARFLVTYGDPNFYSKTGFQQITEAIIQPPFKLSQPEGWLAQSLDGRTISKVECKCSCVSSLSDYRYW